MAQSDFSIFTLVLLLGAQIFSFAQFLGPI